MSNENQEQKTDSPEQFLAKLNRLKEGLGVVEDQQVAEALGMTRSALYARKNRSSFPDGRVLALAARRPELCLDVIYILTGEKLDSRAAHSLRSDEAARFGLLVSKANDLETADLVAGIAVAQIERIARVRAARRDQYISVLEMFDTMSDNSFFSLLEVITLARLGDGQLQLQAARQRGTNSGASAVTPATSARSMTDKAKSAAKEKIQEVPCPQQTEKPRATKSGNDPAPRRRM